jgi:uncharacterized protein
VDALMKATKGEYTGSGKRRGNSGKQAPLGIVILIAIIAAVIRMFGGFRSYGISSRGYRSSGMWWGGGMGGFGGGGSGFGGGGGGWSGGGGSFGGGGASGSW